MKTVLLARLNFWSIFNTLSLLNFIWYFLLFHISLYKFISFIPINSIRLIIIKILWMLDFLHNQVFLWLEHFVFHFYVLF
jgi:hypothetical protein